MKFFIEIDYNHPNFKGFVLTKVRNKKFKKSFKCSNLEVALSGKEVMQNVNWRIYKAQKELIKDVEHYKKQRLNKLAEKKKLNINIQK